MTEDITIVLNGYKRPHVLKEQYDAVMKQTIQPSSIMYWKNNAPGSQQPSLDVVKNCVSFVGNQNLGVWARFAFALMAKTKYVCVLDDDTIPGSRWLENCVQENSKQRGLYGTIGVIFNSPAGYDGKQYRVGWDAPNEETTQVDIVGHAWFFEKELLSLFWREQPNPKFITAGEDIHFSYMLQKYAGIETYVPPHPLTDKTLWGSNPETAIRFGADHNATAPHAIPLMNEYIQVARKGGFKFQFER